MFVNISHISTRTTYTFYSNFQVVLLPYITIIFFSHQNFKCCDCIFKLQFEYTTFANTLKTLTYHLHCMTWESKESRYILQYSINNIIILQNIVKHFIMRGQEHLTSIFWSNKMHVLHVISAGLDMWMDLIWSHWKIGPIISTPPFRDLRSGTLRAEWGAALSDSILIVRGTFTHTYHTGWPVPYNQDAPRLTPAHHPHTHQLLPSRPHTTCSFPRNISSAECYCD